MLIHVRIPETPLMNQTFPPSHLPSCFALLSIAKRIAGPAHCCQLLRVRGVFQSRFEVIYARSWCHLWFANFANERPFRKQREHNLYPILRSGSGLQSFESFEILMLKLAKRAKTNADGSFFSLHRERRPRSDPTCGSSDAEWAGLFEARIY